MTTVAELNRQIAELTAVRDATECRHCGHPYKKHDARGCATVDVSAAYITKDGPKVRWCPCKGFADPAVIAGQEQLELVQPCGEVPSLTGGPESKGE